MLSVDKIQNVGVYKLGSKKRQKEDTSFGSGVYLNPSQRGEFIDKLFNLGRKDVVERLSSALDVMPHFSSETHPERKNANGFFRALYFNLTGGEEIGLEKAVSDSLNLEPNDTERMFIKPKFDKILASIETNEGYANFYNKLSQGLFSDAVKFPSYEHTAVVQSNIIKSHFKPGVTPGVSKIESVGLESVNEREIENQIGRKSKAKIEQGEIVRDAKSGIGKRILESQEIGHEIKSYENQLQKINAEIKRLEGSRNKKIGQSEAYEIEKKRKSYANQISFIDSQRGKLSLEELETKLSEITNNKPSAAYDKKTQKKIARYKELINQARNSESKSANGSSEKLKSAFERFNKENPSLTELSKQIGEINNKLNFEENFAAELAKLQANTALTPLNQKQFIEYKNAVSSMEKENETLLPVLQKLEKVGEKHFYVKIDYTQKLGEHDANMPTEAVFNTKKGLDKALKNWQAKRKNIEANVKLADKFAQNEAKIVDFNQKIKDLKAQDSLNPQTSLAVEKLLKEKQAVQEFLETLNPQTQKTGKQALEEELFYLEKTKQELVSQMKEIWELDSQISQLMDKQQIAKTRIEGANVRRDNVDRDRVALEKRLENAMKKRSEKTSESKQAEPKHSKSKHCSSKSVDRDLRISEKPGAGKRVSAERNSVSNETLNIQAATASPSSSEKAATSASASESSRLPIASPEESIASKSPRARRREKHIKRSKPVKNEKIKNVKVSKKAVDKVKTEKAATKYEMTPLQEAEHFELSVKLSCIADKETALREKYDDCLFLLCGGKRENYGMRAQNLMQVARERIHNLGRVDGDKKERADVLLNKVLTTIRAKNAGAEETDGLYNLIENLQEQINIAQGAEKTQLEQELSVLVSKKKSVEALRDDLLAQSKALGLETAELRKKADILQYGGIFDENTLKEGV